MPRYFRILLSTSLTILICINIISTAVAQNFQPAIVINSLLDMRFYEQTGGFMVGRLQIVFPPEQLNNASFSIMDSNGKQIDSVPLRMEKWDNFAVFNGLSPNGHPGIIKLNRQGDFVMSVNINGKEISRLPFKLTATASGDPFKPETRYTREGMWKTRAFFSVDPEKPQEALLINFWSGTNESAPGKKKAKIGVRIFKDKELIASSRSFIVVSATDWQFLSLPLVQPKTSGGKNLTLETLTANDGTYRVELLANDKVFRQMEAKVTSGQLQTIAETDLKFEPHTAFISPRIIDTRSGSSSSYKMLEAYWIQ